MNKEELEKTIQQIKTLLQHYEGELAEIEKQKEIDYLTWWPEYGAKYYFVGEGDFIKWKDYQSGFHPIESSRSSIPNLHKLN